MMRELWTVLRDEYRKDPMLFVLPFVPGTILAVGMVIIAITNGVR